MSKWRLDSRYQLSVLETPQAMAAVEDLQRLVWPGDETEVVPAHVLLAAAHNGGLVVGVYDFGSRSETDRVSPETGFESIAQDIPPEAQMIGFVFGFPGLYFIPDGPRPKHCSHMMGVHPEHRDQGIGFALKRAQWQIVRHQGLDRITWTYDPLLSRNAHLNIARLGAVCNTYLREVYGEMRDGLNVGLPSDRFQVDWWVNSRRVDRRLSKEARRKLDLEHILAAGAIILNPTQVDQDGLPRLVTQENLIDAWAQVDGREGHPVTLVEIPSDFMDLKVTDMSLAYEWRMHIRTLFEDLFERGYLVTDFVHLRVPHPRSFYVLVHGESTL